MTSYFTQKQADGPAVGGCRENFAAFRRLVAAEESLYADLLAFAEIEDLAARAVQVGAERGLVFTAEDVRTAFSAARREWMERHLA